jgi:PBP1b-binding outer membrane lipoprotein LpoB
MEMNHVMKATFVLTVGLSILAGCTGKTKRMSPDEGSEIEVGTGISSQDLRSVAQRMARSMIVLPQIQNAKTPPKIAFVSVQNESNEYINGDVFLNKMRTQLIRNAGGRMVFLDRAITKSIQQENRQKGSGQITSARKQTRMGADFFLTGVIESLDKVAGKGHTTYTRLSFRLTDAGSSVIIWEDEYEIKKHSTTGLMYR